MCGVYGFGLNPKPISYARADDDGGEAGVEEVVQRAENELVEEHGLLLHEKIRHLISCTRTRAHTRAHTHTHMTHMNICLSSTRTACRPLYPR